MTKYIASGLVDHELLTSIVSSVVDRNKTTRRYDWLTVVTGESSSSFSNPVLDDCGNVITDEPPLCILQDANDDGVAISYPVRIHGKRGEMRRELIDWSTISVDRLIDALYICAFDFDADTPEEIEKAITERVEYALDPKNNSVDYFDAKPDYDARGGFWLNGENIDGNSDDLDGLFDLYGAALDYYARCGQALHVNATGYLSDSIYYDNEGRCVNHANGDEALINVFSAQDKSGVEIDFNEISDAEIEAHTI